MKPRKLLTPDIFRTGMLLSHNLGKSQSDEKKKKLWGHIPVVCGFVPCSPVLIFVVFGHNTKNIATRSICVHTYIPRPSLCNFIREKIKCNAYKLKVKSCHVFSLGFKLVIMWLLEWIWTPVFIFLCLEWFGVGFKVISWCLTSKGFCFLYHICICISPKFNSTF